MKNTESTLRTFAILIHLISTDIIVTTAPLSGDLTKHYQNHVLFKHLEVNPLTVPFPPSVFFSSGISYMAIGSSTSRGAVMMPNSWIGEKPLPQLLQPEKPMIFCPGAGSVLSISEWRKKGWRDKKYQVCGLDCLRRDIRQLCRWTYGSEDRSARSFELRLRLW